MALKLCLDESIPIEVQVNVWDPAQKRLRPRAFTALVKDIGQDDLDKLRREGERMIDHILVGVEGLDLVDKGKPVPEDAKLDLVKGSARLSSAVMAAYVGNFTPRSPGPRI